jgi:acetylornithine deacetylase/succinyl-diaminopimelate desuccinylase-like protein
MTRENAIARAAEYHASGAFLADLKRRVAFHTESQVPERAADLNAYLTDELIPSLATLGFVSTIKANPMPDYGPFLIAERHEDASLPTVLIYGHGDVVRGCEAEWRAGLSPWSITIEGDRWYGRGTADNKGQHTINVGALAQVIATRGGKLGYNTKLLIEMGEETGSPGLRMLAEAEKSLLAADLLIASDGTRLAAERPTVFLGSRGSINFELSVNLRESGHHSGNWGGLLANPGTILANAIASLVDARGRILVDRLRPRSIPDSVRRVLGEIEVGGETGGPAIDTDWGEPGLTPTERVFGWNTLEVLAFETGNPRAPTNAIPPTAKATLQVRFVVDTEGANTVEIVREHLAARGFSAVSVAPARMTILGATRLDPEDPWVGWALASIEATTGKKTALLPNLGGSVPNDVFAEVLGMPTIWVPHSYPACSQHAPNEHLLSSVAREGLCLMAGLFWDLGEKGVSIIEARRAKTR